MLRNTIRLRAIITRSPRRLDDGKAAATDALGALLKDVNEWSRTHWIEHRPLAEALPRIPLYILAQVISRDMGDFFPFVTLGIPPSDRDYRQQLAQHYLPVNLSSHHKASVLSMLVSNCSGAVIHPLRPDDPAAVRARLTAAAEKMAVIRADSALSDEQKKEAMREVDVPPPADIWSESEQLVIPAGALQALQKHGHMLAELLVQEQMGVQVPSDASQSPSSSADAGGDGAAAGGAGKETGAVEGGEDFRKKEGAFDVMLSLKDGDRFGLEHTPDVYLNAQSAMLVRAAIVAFAREALPDGLREKVAEWVEALERRRAADEAKAAANAAKESGGEGAGEGKDGDDSAVAEDVAPPPIPLCVIRNDSWNPPRALILPIREQDVSDEVKEQLLGVVRFHVPPGSRAMWMPPFLEYSDGHAESAGAPTRVPKGDAFKPVDDEAVGEGEVSGGSGSGESPFGQKPRGGDAQ